MTHLTLTGQSIITDITEAHHADILRLNESFVRWTAPLDAAALRAALSYADYARQINNGAGILFGYAHDSAVEGHSNLEWLRGRLSNFFYIDRIIIGAEQQGQGLGRKLYEDLACFARSGGYSHLACEVNTQPNNPSSHTFHLRFGFEAIGEPAVLQGQKAVRYYAMPL